MQDGFESLESTPGISGGRKKTTPQTTHSSGPSALLPICGRVCSSHIHLSNCLWTHSVNKSVSSLKGCLRKIIKRYHRETGPVDISHSFRLWCLSSLILFANISLFFLPYFLYPSTCPTPFKCIVSASGLLIPDTHPPTV